MRRLTRHLTILGVLAVAGCAAPVIVSTSQQAVTSIELEYVGKFLVPVTAYSMLPRCPQADGKTCSDPATVAALRDTQRKLHDAIYRLRDFSDAAPQADATALIASTRAQLAAAEASVPATGAKP
ncbi:MAG TPA: hypothetical protein VN632_10450 [Stellaceae bacterium]|nr:hypothetical protein [Stellaceae bacterium]